MLVAAGAGGAAAVDRWGSDGATAGGRCGITGMCGTAAGADDCCAEVAGQKKASRWAEGLQAIATPHQGPTEQAVLALAGPHAMSLEGRRVAAPAAQRKRREGRRCWSPQERRAPLP